MKASFLGIFRSVACCRLSLQEINFFPLLFLALLFVFVQEDAPDSLEDALRLLTRLQTVSTLYDCELFVCVPDHYRYYAVTTVR